MVTAGGEVALLTRGTGRARDYTWVTDPPAVDPRDPWRGLSTFERPTLVVTVRGDEVSLLMSGLPSRRHDETGTPITNTLTFSGPLPSAGDAIEGLVALWLDEVDAPGDPMAGSIAATVERHVAEYLGEDGPRSTRMDGAGLGCALEELAVVPARPAVQKSEARQISRFGDLSSREHRSLFVEHLRACLAAGRGSGAVLNLVGEPSDLPVMEEGLYPVFVLGQGTSFAEADPVTIPEPVRSPSVAPDDTGAMGPKADARWMWRAVALAMSTMVAAAAVLVWIFLRSRRGW